MKTNQIKQNHYIFSDTIAISSTCPFQVAFPQFFVELKLQEHPLWYLRNFQGLSKVKYETNLAWVICFWSLNVRQLYLTIDRIFSGATTPSQSGHGSDINEMVLQNSPKLQHCWNLTIRFFSVIARTLVGVGRGILPLCGDSRCILQRQPTEFYIS